LIGHGHAATFVEDQGVVAVHGHEDWIGMED
jgi:hypothetical protein